MGAFPRLAKQINRPFCDDFLAEVTKGGNDVFQAHLHRAAGIHRQHIDRKARLQARMAIQLVQHHITRRIALYLNHHPHAGAVGFVPDVRNAFDCLFTDKFTNALKKLCLVHLIRDFVHDDGLSVARIRNHLGPRPHDHRSPSGGIGIANACAPHNQRTRREIGPGNNVQQFLDGDARVANIGLTGRNYLARIMRRYICRHTNGDAICTIDQQIGIFRWQHHRLKLRLVIIGAEFNCLFVNIAQQALGGARQP